MLIVASICCMLNVLNLLLLVYSGLLSFFCPCIQFGRNAEALGESCMTYGLSQLVPLLNLYCRVTIRGRIREKKGIEGSCIKDLLCAWCCGPCSLAQEGQVSFITSNMSKQKRIPWFCQSVLLADIQIPFPLISATSGICLPLSAGNCSRWSVHGQRVKPSPLLLKYT